MSIKIRQMRREDRQSIVDLLHRIEAFRPSEVSVAIELIDEYLEAKTSDYICVTASIGDPPTIAGYACYGPTPLAQGVFDLYWIASDPLSGRRGVGAALLKYVENETKSLGARMLIIETESNPLYEKAIRFYQKQGYTEEVRIKDFYSPGNDKLVFIKRFNQPAS